MIRCCLINKLAILVTLLPTQVDCRDFKIGLLIPKDQNLSTYAWYTSASAISIAADRIERDGLLAGHSFSVVWRDTQGLPVQAAGTAVELRRHNVDVIIGPPQSICTIPVAYLTSFWDIPHLSWKSSDTRLDNKADDTGFSTLVRTISPFHTIGKMFVEIFLHFGWKQAGLLTLTEGQCKSDSEGIRASLVAQNVTVVEDLKFENHGITDTALELHLEQLRRHVRIIILCAEDHQLRTILRKAHDKGMTNPEYAYFVSKSRPPDRHDVYAPARVDGPVDSRLEDAYKYVLDVTLPASFGGDMDAFREEIPKRMAQPPWNSTYALDNNLIGSQYSAYLYDAVYTYASALNLSMSLGLNYSSGRVIFDMVKNVSFRSMTGHASFSEDADRLPVFWVWSYKDGSHLPKKIASFDIFKKPGERVVFDTPPTWHTDDGLPPRDVPVCGYLGQLCPVDNTARNNALIGGVVAAVVIVVMGTIATHFFRRRQFESQLAMMLWKVAYEDIELTTKNLAIGSQMSMKSNRSNRSCEGAVADHAVSSGIVIGRYKGNLVVVKNLGEDSVQLSRDQQIELKTMRDLNHKNVNPFVGACVDAPHICVVYMMCAKGSLPDILENDDIKLDWMFKFSLINDIVNDKKNAAICQSFMYEGPSISSRTDPEGIEGMAYIHSTQLQCHGRLKSSRCVIDSRWMLKLTDYGLATLMRPESGKGEEDGLDIHKGLLWTAPELLRLTPIPLKGTQSGDVYSFAIILHEICYRAGPFPSDLLTPKEIMEKVQAGDATPYRPSSVPDVTVDKSLVSLMEQCWTEASDKRPDFSAIKHTLKQNKKFSNKDNIMDTMLKMMEKYANNLEDLVEQRTQELVDEKVKTDALLYRLLPLPVAEKLKSGESVDPELFDCVTIFFSDIVGFTSISALSSPMEVVTLLNDLYTLFDDIIAQFDLYKVETIGDAYMVVSGLPKRIHDHASQITDMSLNIISSLMQFTVRHMPDRKLKVRIGLHSGPCCAGVVGLTMPRYCLFGDTVNTASKMESHGMPMRIHVSRLCAELLRKIGGYSISKRGLINIKDKGQYVTYWVDGKDTYDRILPDPATFDIDAAVIPDVVASTPDLQK